MVGFIIRRLLWTIPVLLLVILMTFLMMRHIQGNPFRHSERAVSPEIQANLDRKFNLDKPWYVQYLLYVKGVATFDLGPSLVLRNQSVNDIVKEHFPKSLELGFLAMVFAVVIGIPLGVIAALRPNSVFDYTAMFFSNVGFAVPSFLIATLLIYFFALKWGDIFGLPTSGWDTWQSKILPVIALGLGPMAYFARLVRGTMLETLQQDYVRTAKAKGLRSHRILLVHVLKNSLTPAVTAAGPLLGFLITGSFIIEYIFAIPGIGKYYITAVSARDYSVVMGLTVLLSVIVVLANMVVDILYGVLDPRTREARADGRLPATAAHALAGSGARGRLPGRRGSPDPPVEPLARRQAPLHAQQGRRHRRRHLPCRSSPSASSSRSSRRTTRTRSTSRTHISRRAWRIRSGPTSSAAIS